MQMLFLPKQVCQRIHVDEMRQSLMCGVRGAGKQPGDLRRSQNWVAAAAQETRPSCRR